MRIVHVDSAFEWRGGQNQVLLAARGMAERGHTVTLACRKGGRLAERASAAGLDVRELAFGGDLAPAGILALARMVARQAPDVVHCHDPHATAAGLVASRLACTARVVSSRRVELPLRGALSLRKYAACDRVIAVSRAVAGVLADGGLGPDRLQVVYDGVPDRPAAGRAAETLAELGIPGDSPVIGVVASLTPQKGHSTLLEAMPRVLRVLPQARLVIVGDGEWRRRLEIQARDLGLGGRCVFTGFRNDVDRLVPAFSVMCSASRSEGLGTSLLDAMCFRRPIVATAIGGIPEVVRHGETGLLVRPDDALALAHALVVLLLDAGRRENMGLAARRRFERQFTAERMVDETLDAYDELRRSSSPARQAGDLALARNGR